MKIIRNEKLIHRNARLAQVSMLGGLFILGAGMFISFRYPEQFFFSLAALVLGFILSQIGIYLSNRWAKKPRPDEILDQALKGLDDKYSLYHYESPVPHLLLGPCGVWILNPRNQRGTMSYSNGRWRQRGGNLYLKIFAQDNLGRPDLEMQSEEIKLQQFFEKHLSEENRPDISSALIFTNPQAELELSEDDPPPIETVYITKLKDLIRKYTKAKTLSMDDLTVIQNLIEAS